MIVYVRCIVKEDEISEICKALGNPNRLTIIRLLTSGELCACKLLEELHITQPTLSHHMKILYEAGLISIREEGKWSYYSINCEKFNEFKVFFDGITCKKRVKNQKSTCCCGDGK